MTKRCIVVLFLLTGSVFAADDVVLPSWASNAAWADVPPIAVTPPPAEVPNSTIDSAVTETYSSAKQPESSIVAIGYSNVSIQPLVSIRSIEYSLSGRQPLISIRSIIDARSTFDSAIMERSFAIWDAPALWKNLVIETGSDSLDPTVVNRWSPMGIEYQRLNATGIDALRNEHTRRELREYLMKVNVARERSQRFGR